ncbi:MAG: DUF3179 domain-containing protein [Saprospiraceae bacterium]|uniref:DUF3179 domain-containing protein n=1 Tax=Candidatus Opimibacter skivensis TaxID=2982028 RepID=A0A9D7SUF0_9BACT|nr:DUF3179 domain-containing protein [Candidatus Opimibacter skivensis]
MKKLFYLGTLGLILFEIANVYFIMPIPGSQEMNSISLAYFLHSHQWIFRIVFVLMILSGLRSSWKRSKILVLISFALIGVVAYMVNFKMVADHMFYQPKQLTLLNASANKVDNDKLIIGVEYNNEARAYPIQFLGFHHQVRDSIGGRPIMVTYCTVCRTGRVFEPIVNGKEETFRLVGMDHYNAMFEDKTTKSWWRQENGEAIAGELKGQALPEFPSSQSTLGNWLTLHPNSLIMQPDTSFKSEYDSLANYEGGRRTGKLTRRDTLSWQKKSWVAGITVNNTSKAYDWNELMTKQIINDVISAQPVVLFLATDNKSLFAFKRNSEAQNFSIRNDTLSDGLIQYDLSGRPYQDSLKNLVPLQVYQEYWHSWKQFHPETLHGE